MDVAIIGAGGAGICALRHFLNEGYDCEIFERTGNVGGVWNYVESTDVDENGYTVHSPMYKNLRTNVPKEVMAFADFPYPEQKESYVTRTEVLKYIQSYVAHHKLQPYIKLYQHILLVEPFQQKWKIQIEDSKTKVVREKIVDYVVVCNGHHSKDYLPDNVEGLNTFKGTWCHSCLFREPETYRNKRVLIVGGGPSGTDIAKQIATVASKVYISIKTLEPPLPDEFFSSVGLIKKPVIQKVNETNVTFEDGSIEDIDAIMFCTGYAYSFPFLSSNCKISVDDNWVKYLYKEIINVEYPTMGFIGIPFTVCPFPMFDIQVRFFLSVIKGTCKLPCRGKMLEEVYERRNQAVAKKYIHKIGSGVKQREYFNDLAVTGDLKRMPDVIHKLYDRVRANRNIKDCFKIVDNETFIQIA